MLSTSVDNHLLGTNFLVEPYRLPTIPKPTTTTTIQSVSTGCQWCNVGILSHRGGETQHFSLKTKYRNLRRDNPGADVSEAKKSKSEGEAELYGGNQGDRERTKDFYGHPDDADYVPAASVAETKKSASTRKSALGENKHELYDGGYDENTEVELYKDDIKLDHLRETQENGEENEAESVVSDGRSVRNVGHQGDLFVPANGGGGAIIERDSHVSSRSSFRDLFTSRWYSPVVVVLLLILCWFHCLRRFRCCCILRQCTSWV